MMRKQSPIPKRLIHCFALLLFLLTIACGKEAVEKAGEPTEHPLITKGLKFMEEGDSEKALIQIHELLNRDPNHVGGMVALCKVFIRTERYHDADKWANAALKIDKDFADPYAILAEVNFRTSRFEKALKLGRQALIMDPTLPGPYRVIGSVYLRQGEIEAGIKVLKESLRLKPGDTRTLEKLAAGYVKAKQYKLALEQLNIANEIKPDIPAIHYNYAVVYTNLNDGVKAMKHVSYAEELYKQNDDVRWASISRHNKAAIAKKFKLQPEDIMGTAN